MLLQLEVTYRDGSSAQIVTDGSWKVRGSRIRYAEIYHGEFFDASYHLDAVYPSKMIAFDPVGMHGGTKVSAMAFDQMLPVSAEDVGRIADILKDYTIEPDQVPEMIMDI